MRPEFDDAAQAVAQARDVIHSDAGRALPRERHTRGDRRLAEARRTPGHELSQPDADVLVSNEGTANIAELQAQREALMRRKDELSALFREGVFDGAAVRRDAAILTAKIVDLGRRLVDATRTSPAASLVAAGPKLFERWEAMTPAQRGQAVDELAVITVLPCPLGLRRFDPAYVRHRWPGNRRRARRDPAMRVIGPERRALGSPVQVDTTGRPRPPAMGVRGR